MTPFPFKSDIGLSNRAAEALREMAREIARLSSMFPRDGGNENAQTIERIRVKLTSQTGSPPCYSGTEQSFTTAGTPTDKPNGRTFSPSTMPIYERNGLTVSAASLTAGYHVWVDRRVLVDGTPHYEFDIGEAASDFTLAGRTGSSTISPGDTLTLNNGTVSGDAWTPDEADTAVKGIVNFDAVNQNFGGPKTFRDKATFRSGLEINNGGGNSVTQIFPTATRLDVQVFDGSDTVYMQLDATNSTLDLGDSGGSNGPDAIRFWDSFGTPHTGQTATLGPGATCYGGIIDNAGSGSFTEASQDAVGTILTDTATVDFTYSDATPSITADVIRQMSITADGSGLKLSGDSASPGNSKYYGTDSGGTKGYHSLTVSGSAGGDLSGTYPNPTVAKINGATLGSTTATDKNILIADGSSWVTRALSGDATISNTGTLTLSTTAITGKSADASPDAAADYVLTYDASATALKKVLLQNLPSAASPPFADTQTIIKGSSDATKLVRFEVDGLTTGTTRVLTVLDKDYTIGDALLDADQTWAQTQDFEVIGLLDTGSDHHVRFTIGDNQSANRTVTINVADADRTLALSGNLTVSGAATLPAGTMVPNSVTLTAAGLVTGGGDLSANRTFTVTAASQGDQETGTSTSVAVTPGVQKYHPSASKAWARWDASSGTPTNVASYNIASYTDHSAGNVTINFTTAFSAGTSYNWTTGNTTAGDLASVGWIWLSTSAPSTTAFRVSVTNSAISAGVDYTYNSLSFHGDQ